MSEALEAETRDAAGRRPRARPWRALGVPLGWALAGALLILLLSQIPASHEVDLGGYDAAYTQGFFDREAEEGQPALAGSDGSARWSGPSAALIFPQAGVGGELVLRLRGWRPEGQPPPQVRILQNGQAELAALQADGGWQELRLPLAGGLLKASDFFVEIRSDTFSPAGDSRELGVLVDRATYRTAPGPVLPYPAQLAYASLAGGLLWALLGRRPGGARLVGGGLLIYGLAWLLLYRLQPPLYPYPLRLLPPLAVLAMAGLLALRDGPALAARAPALLGRAAPAAVIAAWLGATLLAGRAHLTLSRPGVENDFRVFATRESLAQVFSADGFYNLGYPLLLWLLRPLFEGNAFLAGRLAAALSGAALLAAGYWLARALLPAGPALLALVALALSGMVAQYGLYLGSDMPLAACMALCVAGVAWALRGGRGEGERATGRADEGLATGARGAQPPATSHSRPQIGLAILAGLFGGAAFLMRHLGLALLPWGLLALLIGGRGHGGRRLALAYGLAFLAAMAPQLTINTTQAGQPLYNQQAKNIWLAVYGGTDWGRWEEAPNDIGLAEVVLADPARFLASWGRNVVGYLGSGAEDTGEFGLALQLRLLGFPANLLALGGLAGWALAGRLRAADGGPRTAGRGPQIVVQWSLLGLILLYVAAVSTAFVLPRFFLPLAPIYAAAAAWAAWRLAGGGRRLLGVGLAMIVVLWGGYAAGAGYVLANQPADEIAAVRMVQATAPDAPIAARVSARLPLAKYSPIAHQVVEWPQGSDTGQALGPADLEAAREAGATYLLWDEAAGPPPLAGGAEALVASSGRYSLYRLEDEQNP